MLCHWNQTTWSEESSVLTLCRFYLHYHPSQDRSLVLYDRGTDPLVQGWQNCIGAASDQVGFGYGLLGKNRPLKEGGERGVVLLYLPTNVT